MKNKFKGVMLALFAFCVPLKAADVWIEAEAFSNKGGWVVDQQFTNTMGSSYLMAHGLGKPVDDATHTIQIPQAGNYTLFVRTYNWVSPWYKGDGPGAFQLSVGGNRLEQIVGTRGDKWEWQEVGNIVLPAGKTEVSLHDLTGFNGRVDAIYLTTEATKQPPSDAIKLLYWRERFLKHKSKRQQLENCDLVVTGGGVAGMCAAVSAARLGLKVVLIHDRPILGGCNSSEVRVHLGGAINKPPYIELGNLIKEFGPLKGGNAQAASHYEDEKKWEWVKAEKNITLLAGYQAFEVNKKRDRITSIVARNIETGAELEVKAPLFADCTGDGTVGYLAGAYYMMGREGRDVYGEPTAPEKSDSMTMGASVQWYSKVSDQPISFPEFCYGIAFTDESVEKVTMGEWTWETGMNLNKITQSEQIRDYGLLVVFSNWSYLKNNYRESGRYLHRNLEWVAYVAGKRESRRLVGDYVLREQDLTQRVKYPDGTATTTWSIDLHYPDPENSKYFEGKEFKSIAKHLTIYSYPIPYRCLYSQNITNLFMAGRNISVSHVALGTVRVMRTTGMMGEVVGMAASLCKKEGLLPRGIYEKSLPALQELMRKGAGKVGLENKQTYNIGGSLGD